MPLILAGKSCADCEQLFHIRKQGTDWRKAERVSDCAGLLASAEPPNEAVVQREVESSWLLTALPKPLELLVEHRAKFRSNALACARTSCSALPPGSLVSIGEGIFCMSPEFRLLQAVKDLAFAPHVVYGLELCGDHMMFPGSEDGFVECLPRTTPELIGRFLDGCAGVYGANRLRQVLPYLSPHSRSPMESAIFSVLVLNSRRGGFMLEDLELNAPVGHRKCDIYLPDLRLDIEYMGRRRHSGQAKRESDEHRRIMLENAGVTVVTLVYEDASNVSTMNRLVTRIRAARGLPVTAPTRGVLEARNRLFASLMPGGFAACNPSAEITRWREYARSVVGQ